MLRVLGLALLCGLTFTLHAQQETEMPLGMEPPGGEEKGELTGEGGLGMAVNRGNTDSENLNAKLRLAYQVERWKHQFALEARKNTENEITIGERYLFTAKTDYNFSEHAYSFGALRYDDDRFSGFAYQSSLTAGIGWHAIDSDKTKFDLEIGAGHKESKLETGLMTDKETIGRLGEHYETRLTDTTRIIQDLLIEGSSGQTTTELNTALNVAMNSHLALQLSFGVKRTSNPPPGLEDTDSVSAVNLVYSFSGHK
jgi:putative salt-induced outer membrane protein